MSGSGTKFLASALLALNLLPGSLGAQTLSSGTVSPNSATSSGSRFSGAGKSLETQDPPAAEAATQTPGQQPPVEQDPQLERALRRLAINRTLIEAARNDFERVLKLSEDGYSKDLRRRETQLTKYLKRSNPIIPAAVFLDPNKFDTALALGYTPKAATERMLNSKGVQVNESILKGIISGMKTDDNSPFAAPDSYTQGPSANFDDFDRNPQVCVVVPMSSYAPAIQVKGLSFKENIDWANRHEGWHCADTKFSMTSVSQEEVSKINPEYLEASLDSPEQMKAISLANRREALSDVGAAGDMIRHGSKIGIIGSIVAARHEMPDDIIHYTAGSLEGLKAKIQEIGLDKFRNLNDREAKKLYESVVDNTAMTPKMAEVVITYRKGGDEDRQIVRDAPQILRTLDTLMTAGQAVRDGADARTLDDALARVPAGDDKTLMALATLRDQIREIGVDRFRQLSGADAEKISAALVDSGGMTGRMPDSVTAYWNATPEDRAAIRKEIAEYQVAAPKGVAFAQAYGEPLSDAEKAALPNPFLQPRQPLSPLEEKVMKDLSAWDAGRLLEDRAIKKEGKITPATLIHAYGKMQDDLRGELKKHPEDPLLRAKVTKLQQSFIHAVQDTDYVAANAARGINIFEKEPGLAKLHEPRAESPPAQPEGAAPKPAVPAKRLQPTAGA